MMTVDERDGVDEFRPRGIQGTVHPGAGS